MMIYYSSVEHTKHYGFDSKDLASFNSIKKSDDGIWMKFTFRRDWSTKSLSIRFDNNEHCDDFVDRLKIALTPGGEIDDIEEEVEENE